MAKYQDTIEMYQGRIKHFTKEIERMFNLMDNAKIDELNHILGNIDDLKRMKEDAERMLEFYLKKQETE